MAEKFLRLFPKQADEFELELLRYMRSAHYAIYQGLILAGHLIDFEGFSTQTGVTVLMTRELMVNQNPEQIARDNIDRQLIACGWVIQGLKRLPT